MPLSEREQRILSEIEQQLLATDTRFARARRQAGSALGPARGVQIGLLGFLLGLVATGLLLRIHVIAAFVVGVGMMVVSGFYLAAHAQAWLQHLIRNGPWWGTEEADEEVG